MAWGILPATVYSSYVKGICTSQWVYVLPEKSESRAEKDREAWENGWEKKKRRFWLYWALRSSIFLVCPPIEWSFLTGSHLGEFNNPLTCYTVTQLSGLSWPHVLSEVNFVLMSMALSSTRCSALWLNNSYPSIPMILQCLTTTAALFLDTTPLTTSK